MHTLFLTEGEFTLDSTGTESLNMDRFLRGLVTGYNKQKGNTKTFYKIEKVTEYRQSQLTLISLTDFIDSKVRSGRGTVCVEQVMPELKLSVLDASSLGNFHSELMAKGILNNLLHGNIKKVILVDVLPFKIDYDELFDSSILQPLKLINLDNVIPHHGLVNDKMYNKELLYLGDRTNLESVSAKMLLAIALNKGHEAYVSIIMDKTIKLSLSGAIEIGYNIDFTTGTGKYSASSLTDLDAFMKSTFKNDIFQVEATKTLTSSSFTDEQLLNFESFLISLKLKLSTIIDS